MPAHCRCLRDFAKDRPFAFFLQDRKRRFEGVNWSAIANFFVPLSAAKYSLSRRYNFGSDLIDAPGAKDVFLELAEGFP